MTKRKYMLKSLVAMTLCFLLLFNLGSTILSADWTDNEEDAKVTATNFSILASELSELTKEELIRKANVKNAKNATINVDDKHFAALKEATTAGSHLVDLIVDGINIPIVVSVEEQKPKSRTSTTDGDVTLTIPAYDGEKWKAGVIYDATITVNFQDASSTGKKVEIALPAGMKFIQYPVKKAPSLSTPETAMGGVLGGLTKVLRHQLKIRFIHLLTGSLVIHS